MSFVGTANSGREDRYAFLAIIASIVGHLAIVVFLVFKPFASPRKPPVIYSVTLESGATKGGMVQIPDKNNKADVAPVKKVNSAAEKEQKPEVKPVVEKVKPEPVKPVKKIEDAEVIIPDKKKIEIPKPTPSAVSTAKPQATPVVATKTAPEPSATVAKVVNKNALPDANKSYQDALQKYMGASTAAGGSGFGAAGTSGKGMGGGLLRSPEWFRYKSLLEAHVKRGWSWHDPRANIAAAVRFSIGKGGEVSSVVITQRSGIAAYDDSVYRAVVRSTPVPPPPPSVYEDFKDVEMDFNSAD